MSEIWGDIVEMQGDHAEMEGDMTEMAGARGSGGGDRVSLRVHACLRGVHASGEPACACMPARYLQGVLLMDATADEAGPREGDDALAPDGRLSKVSVGKAIEGQRGEGHRRSAWKAVEGHRRSAWKAVEGHRRWGLREGGDALALARQHEPAHAQQQRARRQAFDAHGPRQPG